MFGVVPKALWQQTNPADADNRIDLAARCMLIEDGQRLILIDNGMGHKQSDKFFSFYAPWGGHNLHDSLARYGFHPDDITDVFMTHLHFDHCGGGVQWKANRSGYELTFKNATYWTNADHWAWATQPNPREKASFLSENIQPIAESGHLKMIEKPTANQGFCPELGFEVLFVDGHTDKMMIPIISYKGEKVVFCADLLPTAGHIPLPYVMGYDTRPLLTMGEKAHFLQQAADQQYLLWLEHDSHNPLIRVGHTEKGVRLSERFPLETFFENRYHL